MLHAGLALSAGAQISNVQTVGASNTQALISYQAPSVDSCSVAVSETSDFSKLVPDVNPNLFDKADSDQRPGSVVDGVSRIFLAGARAVNKAKDGKWYSRALQADTAHYYRIQCGAATTTGTFRTATIPYNIGPGLPIPQDPDTGDFRWPSTDNADRTQTIVDPNYGSLIRRVSIPGDNPGEVDVKAGVFHQASGSDWSNPSSALVKDRATAHSAGPGWLALTDARVQIGTPYYLGSQSITSVVVRITGSATGGQRTIQACLTIDGANCLGDIRSVALDGSSSTKTIGSPVPIDTWGATLWQQDLTGNTSFGLLVRAVAGVTADIDGVEYDLVTNQTMGQVSAGSFSPCQRALNNVGYRCILPGSGGGGANWLYWINPVTGETRFLGIMYATGWGGNNIFCRENNAIWDNKDSNITYCAGYSGNDLVLLQGRYTGGDQAVKGGTLAPVIWTNLTPQTAFIDQLRAFDNTFDAAAFRCGLETGLGSRLIFSCANGGQNSLGFVAVFDVGTGKPGAGRVTGLLKTFNAPAMRWCGLHSIEPVGDIPWIGITPAYAPGNYAVTLASGLAAATQTTIQVSGEPPFQSAQVGDVFSVESNGELIQIVSKTSPTTWVVTRRKGANALAAIPAGTRLVATCSAFYQASNGAPQIYWDFVNDPRAADQTNRTTVVERVFSGSHMVNRGTARVNPDWQTGFTILSPGIPDSFNQQPNYSIPTNPKVNGVRAEAGVGQNYDGFGDAYQSHPSHENYLAPVPANRDWFADLHPFIGAPQFGSSLTAVAGTNNTYRIAVPPLARQTFPTFARCGGHQLKEVTGPISDTQPYTFCVGSKCRAGAQETDAFLSCPAPVSAKSLCQVSFNGDPTTACMGPMLSATQAIVQYFLDGSPTSVRTLTNGLAAWHNDRTFRILDTPSVLPDGSWILFPSFGNNARRDYYMVKVPSAPRTAPRLRVPVPPGLSPTVFNVPGRSSSVSAVLEYGSTPALGKATKPVKCAEDCRFDVTAREGEAIFYRVVYTGPTGVREPGPVLARFASPGIPVKSSPASDNKGF